MKAINLESVDENKVLAKDVMDSNGRLLAGKNKALTPDLVEVLKKREITTVYIVDDDENSAKKEYSESEINAIKEECRQKLAARFSLPPSGEMMKALFESVLTNMVEGKING